MIAVESPKIMPEPVVQVSARVDLRSGTPLDMIVPGIRLPRRLRGAARARQIEFLAGRACAAQAIARVNAGLSGTVPRMLRSGAPGFPQGTTGSICHAAGFVSAAAANRSTFDAIGIDTEIIARGRRASRVAGRVATRLELEAAIDQAPVDRETAVTLLFSAKESLFKALYSRVRRSFDFLDARVEAIGDGSSGCVRARLLVTLDPRARQGATFEGRFEIADGYVHTGIVIPTSRGFGRPCSTQA
jgi:enterobactin synthetase component D